MSKDTDTLSRKLKWFKISVILLLLLLIVTGLWAYRKANHSSYSKNFSLLDPARQYLNANDYIVNIQNLRIYLHSLEEKYPNNISIYYEQINSGSNISVNKELRLFPASLSKLVQAILIVHKIEEGTLSWNQNIKINKEDISADSGELYKTVKEGDTLSVEYLLKQLLIHSDNTAQNTFKHYLDFSDYEKFQYNTGLQDLYNEKGFISAKEYTRILRVLYTSNFLHPENSQQILEYMSQSTFKDYLSQGVPDNIKFAHKYGENKDFQLFADSGIVYIPNKPYMITVLIKGQDFSPETQAWAVGLMKEISEKAYEVSK